MHPVLLSVLPLFLFLIHTGAAECEDGWIPYKNELCIKAFPDLLPYAEAKDFCSSQGNNVSKASLVMIKESGLQDLLADYTQDMYNTLWLGGKYDEESSQFKWDDGEPLTYTNWQDGYPRNNSATPCIELRPINAILNLKADGKWADVNCQKQIQVMCQRALSWTLQDAIDEIIRIRRELETTKVELQTTQGELQSTKGDLQTTMEDLESTKEEIKSTKEDLQATKEDLQGVSSGLVPVGSIYIEYYNQLAPATLWPNSTWEDITSTYAGLFFRALGSGSGSWGVTQTECAPSISQVQYTSSTTNFATLINITSNGWSGYLGTGKFRTGDDYGEIQRFYTRGCEVRPKNLAVRIWKRTA